MSNKYKNVLKAITVIVCIFAILITLALTIYLKVLPQVVSNKRFTNYLQDIVKDTTGADLVIKSPSLETSLKPVIKLNAGLIKLTKNKEKIFTSIGTETEISFAEILKHKIELKKAGAIYLYVDVNKLTSLFPSEPKKEKKPSDWKVKWFNSLLYIKHCKIVLSPTKDIDMNIEGENMTIADQRNPKYVRFDIKADVTKNNETINLSFTDNDAVYIKNRALYVDGGIIGVNKSKIAINAILDEKNNYNVNVFSKNFDLKNIVSVMNSNLIIANGNDILKSFDNINGKFDFDLNLKNAGLSGKIKISNGYFNVVPFKNLPLTLNKGTIELTPYKLSFKDFDGYYGKQKKNKINLFGEILDYTKTVDTNIMIKGLATNELMKDYVSKLVGTKITLTGDSNAYFNVKFLNNKLNLLWMFKLAKGKDILVDGSSFSPVGYDRVMNGDLLLDGADFKIKSINYYIAPEINRNSKNIRPILTIDGNLDLAKNGAVKDIGFVIPKPLPSEFLNVLIGQKLFRKGTIAGNLRWVETGKYPMLSGNMEMNKVFVPAHRLFIKQAKLSTNNQTVNLETNGRFKRISYDFNGKIKNSMLFPIIVKDAVLTIDNLDVERLLASFNKQNTEEAGKTVEVAKVPETETDLENDETYIFDTNLIIVENSALKIIKGNYKNLKFGNANTRMTLDNQGVLKVHSNRFDFAEGISTLNSICDLKNHDYKVRLGVKDVNSDLIASTLLSLPKEISGKAKGLILLQTDDSLKLNGEMKFSIDNGNIGKIGLVQYIMNVASLFRNPIVMINPTTVFDLANIPNGDFDNISGELKIKSNVIERLMIKSIAPQLSTVIIGRYDIERNDAALRIYTKFSTKTKGTAGFLRNLSLNKLARIVPLGSKNISNYYEAELKMLPPLPNDNTDYQVFLTTVDGDIVNNNFISALKKIK